MTSRRPPKKALLALLPVLLMASAAAARAGHVRPVRLATEAGPDPALSQNLTSLRDGRFAVLLTRADDVELGGYSTNSTTFLQYVDGRGALAFARPGIVVTESSLQGSQAALVAHPNDGVFVAVRRLLDAANSRIAVQWFDGQGRPRWGAGSLAAPVAAGEDQSEPYVVAGGDGGAAVCFVRWGEGSPGSYCQRFSPEGRRLWRRGGARIGPAAPFVERIQAVAAADGGLLVFWGDQGGPRGSGCGTFIRGQRLSADGSGAWGEEAKILSRGRASGVTPWVFAVSDGAGGAIVAYEDQVRPIPEGVDFNHVTAQRISADGEELWGEGVSPFPNRPPHVLYSLVAGPDGGAFVGVGQFPFPVDDFWIDVAFQRLDADGSLLWPPGGVRLTEPVPVIQSDFEFPAVGFDGHVLRVAWEHELPETDTQARSSEILFTAFDPQGNRLTERSSIAFTDARGYKALGGLALDPATGTSFVVWRGGDNVAGYYTDGVVYTPPP